MDARENGSITTGRNLKKVVYIISLAGFALFFTACMGGYVATEPNYTESERPEAPSNLHVWVDGDWAWNRQTQVYVKNPGYWSRPNPGRTYVSGHWQTSSRGHSWVKGCWQRQNHQENRYNQ